MLYIENLEELSNTSFDKLPMLVFETNFTGFFSFGIRARRNAIYSHFMWHHEPGHFASQNVYFRHIPSTKSKKNKLKLWYNPHWTPIQRAMLVERIYHEIERPRWKTRYDWLNVIGQLIGLKVLQNPFTNICSETAKFLTLVDPNYDLCNPAPDEINEWLKEQPNYEVFARYSPD